MTTRLDFHALYLRAVCLPLQPIEAAHVQAYNDFIIFSVAGGGSLISGVIYAAYGTSLAFTSQQILLRGTSNL